MIHIIKSDQIPDILTDEKTAAARSRIEDMIRDDQTPQSKDFDRKIYNGMGVKNQLLVDQNNKCAYCEVSMAGDNGAVEHYRPKAGWKENTDAPRQVPGYYWLAYDWSNLLCSCDKCNSAACKGSLFPLRDPATRDIDNKNISREVPLIINPSQEDPGLYIRFNQHIAVPSIANGVESDKGRTTIEVFDLNERAALLQARRDKWLEARRLYEILVSSGMERCCAINTVKDIYAQPCKQYAGMFTNQDMWFV